MTTKRVETMKEAIDKAVKEGLQALHRTVDEDDPSRHRADVCIICDCFISGTDSIKYLKASEIRKHKSRIGSGWDTSITLGEENFQWLCYMRYVLQWNEPQPL